MSGLDRSKKILSHLNEISVIDFDHTDVVRHPLVRAIIKAYDADDEKREAERAARKALKEKLLVEQDQLVEQEIDKEVKIVEAEIEELRIKSPEKITSAL